jgi:hypothetical protein
MSPIFMNVTTFHQRKLLRTQHRYPAIVHARLWGGFGGGTRGLSGDELPELVHQDVERSVHQIQRFGALQVLRLNLEEVVEVDVGLVVHCLVLVEIQRRHLGVGYYGAPMLRNGNVPHMVSPGLRSSVVLVLYSDPAERGHRHTTSDELAFRLVGVPDEDKVVGRRLVNPGLLAEKTGFGFISGLESSREEQTDARRDGVVLLDMCGRSALAALDSRSVAVFGGRGRQRRCLVAGARGGGKRL